MWIPQALSILQHLQVGYHYYPFGGWTAYSEWGTGDPWHTLTYCLHEEDKARDLTESLQKEWNKHVNELNKNKECKVQPSLWKCIVRTTSLRKISFLTCFVLLESVCRVLQPLFLGFLLHLLRSSERDYSLAYGCSFLLALSGLSTACIHYTGYQLELLGMRLSSAIKGLIYLKVSHLDSKRSL